MRGRLQARGLVLALAVVILLLLSPTPVPRAAREVWRAASLAAASGDIDSLTGSLQDLQAVFPWLDEPRQAEIPLLLAKGDGARALTLLEAGVATQADPLLTACWRSQALMLEARWDDAVQALPPTAAVTCPEARDRLAAQAKETLARMDLLDAIGILRALTSSYPNDSEAAALLGACLLLTEPGTALPYLAAAASSGDQLAIDLRAALQPASAGDEPGALALAGQVFLQHEHWPLAALAFQRLTNFDPANAEAYAYLGLALQRSGFDGRAELERAVALSPESPLTQSALGLYWQAAGQPGKALSYLRQAAELDPDNAAFAASLAAALAAGGDIQAALDHFRHAAQIEPTDPIFWSLLADFSLSRRMEVAETGLPAARNAAALEPGSATRLDLLGYGHLLLGNHVLAERFLTRAVSLDPGYAAARLHYGLLLRTLGREAEAVVQLRAASELGGDSPLGELARRALTPLTP